MGRHLDRSMLRWVLVGCLTVAIDWVIFVSVYPRIGSVALTNLISGSFSTAFNYFAHRRWTFRSGQPHIQSGTRYGIALFGIYLLNTILVKIFILSSIATGLAKLLAGVIQAPMNYFVLNLFVFKRKK